jgi:hypothetical protein
MLKGDNKGNNDTNLPEICSNIALTLDCRNFISRENDFCFRCTLKLTAEYQRDRGRYELLDK